MRWIVSTISVPRSIGSPPASDTNHPTYAQSVSQSAEGAGNAVVALAVFYRLPSPAALGCDHTPMGDRPDLKLGPLIMTTAWRLVFAAGIAAATISSRSVTTRSTTVMTL
jgi:hypothetical protein